MNNNDKHIELIDRYINDELTNEERSTFEARLLNDDTFYKEYEHQLALQQGIHLLGDQQLKDVLDKTHHAFIEKEVRIQAKIKYYLIIGVVGLFSLLMGVILILNPQSSAEKRKETNRARAFSYKEKFHIREDLKTIKQQDSITQLNQKSNTISPSKKIQITFIDTLYFQVKAYAPIIEKKYILTDNALLLYGIELDNEAHIFLQNNRQLLLNNSHTYPITEVHKQTKLTETHIRINETAIKTKNIKTINSTQYLFEKIPHDYSIRIKLTTQPDLDSSYNFHKQTLTMGKNSFNQLFPNKISILYFNDHYFIEHNHHLYTLENGDQLKFTEKNIDHDIKSILSPQKMDVPIITETVENLLDLESSN